MSPRVATGVVVVIGRVQNTPIGIRMKRRVVVRGVVRRSTYAIMARVRAIGVLLPRTGLSSCVALAFISDVSKTFKPFQQTCPLSLYSGRVSFRVIRVLCVLDPAKTLTLKGVLYASARVVDLPPASFAPGSFCTTIIANNLFPPLGWTPPQPIEPNRMIGTILPRSEPHCVAGFRRCITDRPNRRGHSRCDFFI